VDRQVAHHDVERGVLERQARDVGGVHLDPAGDALQLRVPERRGRRVAGLVGLPEIGPHGPAPREQPGRGQQHGAAPAAEVQQPLVSAQVQALQEVRPDRELP
jgi:hypothetical protein